MSASEQAEVPVDALSVFGGRDAVIDRIKVTLEGTMNARSWSASDLARAAHAGDERVVKDFLEKSVVPPKDILLSYFTALGIRIQHALHVEKLTDSAKQYWLAEMKRRKVAMLAAAGGPEYPEELDKPQRQQWLLELFLRIEALDELSPSVQLSEKKQQDVNRVRARLAKCK